MTELVRLGAGGGGDEQRALIESIRQRLANPVLNRLEDSAVLALPQTSGRLAFTTDSYVVHPYRFPGGDVGSLAVCGTVNDIAVMGAVPRWLSLGLILEEGLPYSELEQVLDSIADRARQAGVDIVTGDTKVVERGKGDGIYINTSGIGLLPLGRDYGVHRLAPGQALIVNGSLGDHAITVLLARENLGFESDLQSDCAPLNALIELLINTAGPECVYAMRDLTRGGLAAVLNEFAQSAQMDMLINEGDLPVKPAVRSAARVLGFEPAVLANEGKFIAAVRQDKADAIVKALRECEYGADACVIGETGGRFDPQSVDSTRPHRPLVLFKTLSRGVRIVDMPLGELLPRIC